MNTKHLLSLPLKDRIETLLSYIAQRYNKKRPENFLSDLFDVDVYAIRQWTVRGIPMRHREKFAELVGISEKALERLHAS